MWTEIVTALVGATIAGLFALVAYFLNRLINDNDRFQDETRRSITTLGRKIDRNEMSIAETRKEIARGAFDEETKRKIKTLSSSIVEVEKEISLIKPSLQKMDAQYGRVIVIGNKMEAQEKKILGLYTALKKLIESKRVPQ